MARIPLIKPYVTDEVKARVCEVLDSGHLTEGGVTRELEEAIKNYIGCNYTIAVSNCTVGLEIALKAVGVGPGDEVIVPDYTYPATALAVMSVGAKPVIVDIDRSSMLIDYVLTRKAITPKTKAIIPVSLFGNPVDYDELNIIRMSGYKPISIIEDAACSLGSKYSHTMTGNLADITVFSFHPRKFITTGEGGMITTNDYGLASWMRSYAHFGQTRRGFSMPGINAKMSDLQAAVGVVQMKHINELLEERTRLALRYWRHFNNGQIVTNHGIHSWQSFCVFIEKRDEAIAHLARLGIETQIGTYSLHLQPAFMGTPARPQSRYAYEHCLTLPLYHGMTELEQDLMINAVRKWI